MTADEAETIAAQALAYIAGDEDLLLRFMALSGLTLDEIRQNISDSGLLGGALRFLTDHEPDAKAFCQSAGLEPGRAALAREVLAHAEAGNGGENAHV